MRILFIGDIVGRPGRQAVKALIPGLKAEFKPDWILANGENLSGGRGINAKHAEEMRSAGIDVFTSGNHIWAQSDIFGTLNDPEGMVLRPANYPPEAPGRGDRVFTNASGHKLLVINLIGRIFMKDHVDCPFKTLDHLLVEHENEKFDGIFMDFHAEATSEKVTLGHYAAGRVTAFVGTHTHVPTADERILKGHTAYISDVGSVGLRDSAIGVDLEPVLQHFLTQMPAKHTITLGGPVAFSAVVIDTDAGRATSIQRIAREWKP